jgi:arginyl-tRNA synthetase
MYSYARATSIIKKAKTTIKQSKKIKSSTKKKETILVKDVKVKKGTP